jgi:heme exporter protein B
MNSALALFAKDVRSELRTRYALNAVLLFVVITISILMFSIGNETVSPEVLAGILWVLIFFSSMSGLSRAFVAEEERGTSMFLQLLAVPSSVYFGKLLFNVVLLALMNSITSVLYLTVVNGFIVKNMTIYLLTQLLGTVALAAASTTTGAIISRANTKGALYSVISFPLLLPLLLTCIDATRLAVEDAPTSEAFGDFRIILSFFVAITAASYILFDFIWKD